MATENHSTRDCLANLVKVGAETKARLDAHIEAYNTSQALEHLEHAEIKENLIDIKAAVTKTKDKFTGWIIAALSFLMVTLAGATVGLIVYIIKILHPS